MPHQQFQTEENTQRLRAAPALLSQGLNEDEVCRQIGVTDNMDSAGPKEYKVTHTTRRRGF